MIHASASSKCDTRVEWPVFRMWRAARASEAASLAAHCGYAVRCVYRFRPLVSRLLETSTPGWSHKRDNNPLCSGPIQPRLRSASGCRVRVTALGEHAPALTGVDLGSRRAARVARRGLEARTDSPGLRGCTVLPTSYTNVETAPGARVRGSPITSPPQSFSKIRGGKEDAVPPSPALAA